MGKVVLGIPAGHHGGLLTLLSSYRADPATRQSCGSVSTGNGNVWAVSLLEPIAFLRFGLCLSGRGAP